MAIWSNLAAGQVCVWDKQLRLSACQEPFTHTHSHLHNQPQMLSQHSGQTRFRNCLSGELIPSSSCRTANSPGFSSKPRQSLLPAPPGSTWCYTARRGSEQSVEVQNLGVTEESLPRMKFKPHPLHTPAPVIKKYTALSWGKKDTLFPNKELNLICMDFWQTLRAIFSKPSVHFLFLFQGK